VLLGARDPMPGLRVLRLANGPDRRGNARLETITEALAALGTRAPGRSCVAVLAGMDHKPRELLHLALARARACERLGEACTPALAAEGFAAGLLSLLDAFLDTPATAGAGCAVTTTARPPAAPAQTEALLATAIAFEKGEWHIAPWDALATLGVGQAEAERAYLESLHWARQAMQAMFTG
jgi:EAL and modified HD-GYP domain-containing signal transduction protein